LKISKSKQGEPKKGKGVNTYWSKLHTFHLNLRPELIAHSDDFTNGLSTSWLESFKEQESWDPGSRQASHHMLALPESVRVLDESTNKWIDTEPISLTTQLSGNVESLSLLAYIRSSFIQKNIIQKNIIQKRIIQKRRIIRNSYSKARSGYTRYEGVWCSRWVGGSKPGKMPYLCFSFSRWVCQPNKWRIPLLIFFLPPRGADSESRKSRIHLSSKVVNWILPRYDNMKKVWNPAYQ